MSTAGPTKKDPELKQDYISTGYAAFSSTALKSSQLAEMGSDSLEHVSSTSLPFQDNGPLLSFQGSGSVHPPQLLEPSAELRKANVSSSDSNCHILPSSSQQAAASILQDFDDAKIFHSLEVLRSLSPNYGPSSHSKDLSIQQLTALSTLKDCRDADILACLEVCRRGSLDNSQVSPGNADNDFHQYTASLNPESWLDTPAPVIALAGSIPGGLSLYASANASENTLRSSLSRANSFVDLSRENSRPPSGTGHQHWCTVCENPSPISTCDGWKRHEKEKHERGYMCMPNGPVEITASGPCCAFCGFLDPSSGHLEIHDARLCADKPDKDRRYTRKLGLINHLKTHGMYEVSALADKWRVWLKKRYYGCGFCISVFTTNADRLNHIDSQHYRYSRTIDEWDPNKVIRGLLLQPSVLDFWQQVSPWNPDPRTADLIWEPHAIAALQQRLELSEEPAYQLANDALYQSSGNYSLPIGSVSNQQTKHGAIMSAGQQQYIIDPGLSSYPSSDTHDMDISSLPYQERNRLCGIRKSNTIDPIQMHTHPTQSMDACHALEITSGYGSSATTHSPWHQYEATNNPLAQPSPDPANVEAAGGSHYRTALGSNGIEYPEFSQGDSSHFTNSFNPRNTSQISGGPFALPSTNKSYNPSFSTVTTATGSAKPPSIVGHVKRRFSRYKMGIDVDDIMLHMQDDERSRSESRGLRRSK